MATIGKHRAVVDLPKFKFQGFIRLGYLWMFLHLMLILRRVKNKLSNLSSIGCGVILNKDSSLRLIIIPTKKNPTEQSRIDIEKCAFQI